MSTDHGGRVPAAGRGARHLGSAGARAAGLVLACGALVLGGCRRDEGAAQPGDGPDSVVTFAAGSPSLQYLAVDTVRTRTERVVAELAAQLVLDEDHTSRISSPVDGRVVSLDVEPGARVAAGQALARIASGDFAQAQSDLARAEAAWRQATAALTRARDLFQHQVISQRDLDQAVTDEATAHAERDRAAARARQLGGQGTGIGQEFVLRSPIRGEVVQRAANPGQQVHAGDATPLFVVSSLDTLWLTASVFERDVGAVRVGQRIVLTTDALPGRRFAARIGYVSDALDPQTRTGTARAVLANPDHALRAEVIGTAKVFGPDSSRAPVVPSIAVVTRGAASVVFVRLAPGRFVARTVQVADDDGETAAIVSGLQPGDVVVTRGSLLLLGQLEQGR